MGDIAQAGQARSLRDRRGRLTRDATDEYLAPAGGFEVFAVPVTIANSGARDAAVLSLQLEAKNPKTGLTGRFDATYIVDAAYFAIRREGERPKAPFSALVIAGRSAWAGTILFYPVTYSNEKALAPAGELQQKIMALRDKHGNLVELEKKLREKNEKMPELDELEAYREHARVHARAPVDARPKRHAGQRLCGRYDRT